jgi:hypothetical protein
MNRRALCLALGLLIIVNALVLLGVAWNRSGRPDAVVLLTERELPLAWSFRQEENSGVSLHLNVNYDHHFQAWFDEDKLSAIGFDTRHSREADWSEVHRALPRKAFVVLEYEGDSWLRYEQRQLEAIEELAVKVGEGKLEPEQGERQKKEKLYQLTVVSRLFPVDAGPDPEVLRQRHPDRNRYLILPATVRMTFDSSGPNQKNRLFGQVQEILVQQLHVPHSMHAPLQALPTANRLHSGYNYFDSANPGRVGYRVEVAVGKRLEPWVRGIEPVGGQ